MFEAVTLREQLQRYLLSGFVLLWLTSASAVHYAAQRFMTAGYDHSLFDTALDLTAQIRLQDDHLRLDLTPALRGVLERDGSDRVYYAVTATSGELIGGTPGLPTPTTESVRLGGVSYYDAIFQAQPLRMAVARLTVGAAGNRQVLVLVGETLHRRNNLGDKILWSMGGLQLVQLVVAVVLVRYAVRRGLRPLSRLVTEIAARSPADLRALSHTGVVSEVQPLVGAMNTLLARLRALLATQQRLIADASHQLRTPLAGIKSQLDLALDADSPQQLQTALGQAHAATERTVHLSHQLLTLARAEPEAIPADAKQVCDLGWLARDVAAQLVPSALVSGVDMAVDIPDGASARVLGDHVLLRELITNLLDNAVRYSGPDGHVTLRMVTTPKDTLLIEVEDDGPGIAPDERQSVFERFYRLPGTPGDGCGLGLAIVAEIADRHGAQVSLHPGTQGRGTLARVEFSRLADSDQLPSPPSRAAI